MITCKVGENIINCYDGTHNKEQLKKWASKNILICPVCNNPYEYCHGEFVSPYFRHKDKCKCEDKYSEPESQEHINGKRDLYEWIRIQEGVSDAVLEGWLPETKQRPDIMFKYNDKQYVIEYQCTPIASEYVERHELYRAAGIKDIWIMGTDKYIEKSEIGKTYREKELEKYSSYYYDSIYKIFIFKNYDNKNLSIPINRYSMLNKRSECSSILLSTDNLKYFIGMEGISFLSDKIIINDIGLKALTKHNDDLKNKEKTRDEFINKCVSNFNEKYQNIGKMTIGNYYNGVKIVFKEYTFFLHEETNTLDFCKEQGYKTHYTQWNGRKMANRTGWNSYYKNLGKLEYFTYDFDLFMDFIIKSLSEPIKTYEDFQDYEMKLENERNKKLLKLEPYINIPIYLLSYTDGKIDDKIRFKVIKDFGESDTLDILIRELDFLKKRNAKKYVFMIPKYKYIETGGIWKNKLRNYLNDAISEITSFGFNVLTYNDLKEELNEKTTTILHNEISTR